MIELQQCVIFHKKGLEKGYSMVIFSETSKNPENTLEQSMENNLILVGYYKSLKKS